jgi:V8-like Glu-specific endopeptidase
MLLAGVGVVLALALFSNNNSGSVTPSPSGKPLLENGGLWQSAVKVAWLAKDADGEFFDCGGGSGGLVGEINQVLTNEHVVNDSENTGDCADASLYVGYPVESTGVYFVWWPGTVRGVNEFTDLALVDVDLTATAIKDNSDYPSSIVLAHTWPVFSIASKEPVIGAPISIYSYPGIGGPSMTFTAGHIAGWAWASWTEKEVAEMSPSWIASYNADLDGYRDFLKIDATTARGSSGSSVLSAAGEIVGVIVIAGSSTQVETTDCRSLADTNDDGSIDDTDSCVPTGGFINGAVTITDIRLFLTTQGVQP